MQLLTAYADLEIHPDGSKKCDGISIMRLPKPSMGIESILERQLFSVPTSECVLHCSLEEAERLVSDLTKVIAHSKKFCK